MQNTYPKSLRRAHWIDSIWVQLPALLICGVLLPPLAYFFGRFEVLLAPTAHVTLLASSSATIVTWYSLEKLRYFAKARRLSYVFPVNALTFGGAFFGIGILRLPYSSALALLTFTSVVCISYVITALTRKSGTRQWLVPGGKISEVIPELDSFTLLDQQQFRRLLEKPSSFDAIVADLHHIDGREWEALIAEAAINGMPVYHYRQILELETGQVRIDHLRENIFGSLIPNLAYTNIKRLIDVVAALIMLPLLLPVFLLLALLIKIDSEGPILFHQDRVGYRGRTFRMHKFRSMKTRAVPVGGDAQRLDAVTQDNDSRITRFGAFIRRYRLDELPQLFNVLKGEMSLIGPRPEAQSLSRHYQEEIPFYRYRHIVRPGITGWAQVNQGHVAAVDDVSEKLRYDFYYIRHISLWLDVLVAMKTLRILLGGFGAK